LFYLESSALLAQPSSARVSTKITKETSMKRFSATHLAVLTFSICGLNAFAQAPGNALPTSVPTEKSAEEKHDEAFEELRQTRVGSNLEEFLATQSKITT
jgi:hypothetical protein